MTTSCQYTNDAHNDDQLAEPSASIQNTPSNQSICIRIVPSIEDPNRCFIFDVVERDLKPGNVIKIGRFADHYSADDHISLRSKVVSRTHCEFWQGHDGKLYLRDTKSSSGTYVNHLRLCGAQQISRPIEIHHGDLVQLGIDYQDGNETYYRAVKMRFEINQRTRPAAYNTAAFQHLKEITGCTNSAAAEQHLSEDDDCCICLYALAPVQALFVAPCSHTFHFRCIRPLLASYPGFQCPLCRSYSDLGADSSTADKASIGYSHQPATSSQANSTGANIQRPQASVPITLATSVTHMSGLDSSQEADEQRERHREVATATTPPRQTSDRRLNPIHLMDKLKMAFTEKRRTSLIRNRHPRQNSDVSSDDEGIPEHQQPVSTTSTSPTSPLTPTFSVHSPGGIAVLTDYPADPNQ